jgi:CRISPR-associated endonuclease/helicase Cas3
VLLNTLKKEGPERWLLRKLQRYGVSIYQRDLQRLLEGGAMSKSLGGDFPGLYVQASDLLVRPGVGHQRGWGAGRSCQSRHLRLATQC